MINSGIDVLGRGLVRNFQQALLAGGSLFLVLLLGACASTPGGQGYAVEPSSTVALSSSATLRARAHTELGMNYFQTGNMAVALEEVRIAISADPRYAPAYNLGGLVHMYLRENSVAEENFRRAIELAPGDPEISNSFGWFLCQTQRERESISYFLASVKNPLYRTPEMSYLNAGICTMAVNDLQAAEDYLQMSLRLSRNNQPALLQMAELRYRGKRFEEARSALKTLHAQSEPTAASLWLAVRLERVLGDRKQQANFTAQLRRKFPDSREAHELRQGKFE